MLTGVVRRPITIGLSSWVALLVSVRVLAATFAVAPDGDDANAGDACPASQHVLPLYLDGDHFSTPFCCYGNDVDCDRCGAWVVFHMAARYGMPVGK